MGVKKYTQEVIKEGKRVRWPKKDVFIPALVTTLVVCVVCALILEFEDFVSSKLVETLRDLFSK